MKRLFVVGLLLAGCMAKSSTPPLDTTVTPGAKPETETTKSKEPSRDQDKASMAPITANADPLASSPEITSGKAEIKGSLAPEEVVGVIRKSLPGLKFCYDEARKKDPTLSGKMKVSFVIDSNGGVNEVKTREGLATELDDCVSRKFAQFKFPPPANGSTVEVSYPLVFNAN